MLRHCSGTKWDVSDGLKKNVSDFVKTLFQIPHSYWGFAASLAVAFYAGMLFVGRHFSAEAKENLTLWLWGEYQSTWSHNFCTLFDTVFGKKHLSWRCFVRSAIASVIAVFALYVFFAEVMGAIGGRMPGDLSVWQALLLGAAINVVPDYVSLFETRWLLKRFDQVRSIGGQLLVLLADAIFTGAIIWAGISLYQLIVAKELPSLVEMVVLFSVFSVFFYSTFLTSVWAWIYCLSTWCMRLFSRGALNKVFDVENKPVAVIALVGAAFIFIGTLSLTLLFRTEDAKKALGLINGSVQTWMRRFALTSSV
jgi:hypothetical protein